MVFQMGGHSPWEEMGRSTSGGCELPPSLLRERSGLFSQLGARAQPLPCALWGGQEGGDGTGLGGKGWGQK